MVSRRLLTVLLCIAAVRELPAQRVSPVAVRHESASPQAALSLNSAATKVDDGLGATYVAFGALVGAGTAALILFHGTHRNDDGMIIPIAPFLEIGAAAIVGGFIGWTIHNPQDR